MQEHSFMQTFINSSCICCLQETRLYQYTNKYGLVVIAVCFDSLPKGLQKVVLRYPISEVLLLVFVQLPIKIEYDTRPF